jgi:hypothetical protein
MRWRRQTRAQHHARCSAFHVRRIFGNGSDSCPRGTLLRFGGPRAAKPARAKPSRIASGVSATPCHRIRLRVISIFDGTFVKIFDERPWRTHRQQRSVVLGRYAPMRTCRDVRAEPATSLTGRIGRLPLQWFHRFPCSKMAYFPSNNLTLHIPSVVSRLPSVVLRLPSFVFRLPSVVLRLSSFVFRPSSSVLRGPPRARARARSGSGAKRRARTITSTSTSTSTSTIDGRRETRDERRETRDGRRETGEGTKDAESP